MKRVPKNKKVKAQIKIGNTHSRELMVSKLLSVFNRITNNRMYAECKKTNFADIDYYGR